MISNLVILLTLVVISYPISRYLMKKGMTLDLTMPFNVTRYKKLGIIFYIPIINIVVIFIYLCYTLHKFKRE